MTRTQNWKRTGDPKVSCFPVHCHSHYNTPPSATFSRGWSSPQPQLSNSTTVTESRHRNERKIKTGHRLVKLPHVHIGQSLVPTLRCYCRSASTRVTMLKFNTQSIIIIKRISISGESIVFLCLSVASRKYLKQ